ncbi:MAG TPA: tRNA dimethylallyltransferase, partial [Prolixibacteraceae bacterium]|nr:tRNA dimethylallyltransferase [Prolixibacteraceae bacterium]
VSQSLSPLVSQSLSPLVSQSLSPLVSPSLSPLIVALHFDVETRRKRITERLHQRLNQGMIEEVGGLLRSGIAPEALTYYGLEYKFITLYLTGELTRQEMIQKLNIAIHQFAKRQMTWFRKMEREGTIIHWIDGNLTLEEKVNQVLELMQTRQES